MITIYIPRKILKHDEITLDEKKNKISEILRVQIQDFIKTQEKTECFVGYDVNLNIDCQEVQRGTFSKSAESCFKVVGIENLEKIVQAVQNILIKYFTDNKLSFYNYTTGETCCLTNENKIERRKIIINILLFDALDSTSKNDSQVIQVEILF